jgi:hypothetical protein
MGPERLLALKNLADLGRAPGFAPGVGEMGAVVRQYGMDLVGYGLDQGMQEVGRNSRRGFLMQLSALSRV